MPLLLLLLVALAALVAPVTAQTNATDQAALVAFYKGITNPANLGWNTTASLCGQTGVTCTSGKVTSL